MRRQFILKLLSCLLLLSLISCSSAPVEEDEPAVEEPQITKDDLRATIEEYIEVCQETCDQSEECIGDTSVYHARTCREDCRANLKLLHMNIDDLEGMNACFEANLSTSRCVVGLSCNDWQTWQDHRGQRDAPEYPCQDLTVTSHRACHPFVEQFRATTR